MRDNGFWGKREKNKFGGQLLSYYAYIVKHAVKMVFVMIPGDKEQNGGIWPQIPVAIHVYVPVAWSSNQQLSYTRFRVFFSNKPTCTPIMTLMMSRAYFNVINTTKMN